MKKIKFITLGLSALALILTAGVIVNSKEEKQEFVRVNAEASEVSIDYVNLGIFFTHWYFF